MVLLIRLSIPTRRTLSRCHRCTVLTAWLPSTTATRSPTPGLLLPATLAERQEHANGMSDLGVRDSIRHERNGPMGTGCPLRAF
jgi:hypothetical protein